MSLSLLTTNKRLNKSRRQQTHNLLFLISENMTSCQVRHSIYLLNLIPPSSTPLSNPQPAEPETRRHLASQPFFQRHRSASHIPQSITLKQYQYPGSLSQPPSANIHPSSISYCIPSFSIVPSFSLRHVPAEKKQRSSILTPSSPGARTL